MAKLWLQPLPTAFVGGKVATPCRMLSPLCWNPPGVLCKGQSGPPHLKQSCSFFINSRDPTDNCRRERDRTHSTETEAGAQPSLSTTLGFNPTQPQSSLCPQWYRIGSTGGCPILPELAIFQALRDVDFSFQKGLFPLELTGTERLGLSLVLCMQ